MSYSRLFFIGIPFILVVVPAVVTIVWQRPYEERISRVQMFFVWLAAYSMFIVALGFLATMFVFFSYGGIPGTATDGGIINGKYYFNWHDQTYTEVSKATWQCAYFLEQLAMHTIWVPASVFVASLLFLFLTRRIFPAFVKDAR